MIKRIPVFCPAFFAGLIFGFGSVKAQDISIVLGMKISKTTKIKKALYKIDARAEMEEAVIIIEGNNITIDFNDAELKGSNKTKRPDEFTGIAILIQNSKNITIKNLVAKGYKVALRATNVETLTLDSCDFSYNYRQHLNSSQEREDISDWMSYHHNEKDEWLRYGAAMYLRNCNFATIKNCKVTGGQNALMMMECNDGKIYMNDFSFNSGIGLGMYRCNRNQVYHNQINFNVRGYSHGVYNRGQDSAGILVFEQSNNNYFSKNSVTHSGDGFFLWAGQTTMDSGKGGCNDNLLDGNDFSYAPTNGVEVTFSRNKIIGNRIIECDHGIWGGYSFDSKIVYNLFVENRIAVAIEHGQHNIIANNSFNNDKEGIRLWSRKEQPADWGYAKYRDTRSADYIIRGNEFINVPLIINATLTDSLYMSGNQYSGYKPLLKIDSTVSNFDTLFKINLFDKYPSTYEFDPVDGRVSLAGRKNIMITEWGPYDFRYPLLWNINPTDTTDVMNFSIMGPKGKHRIVSMKGVCCKSDADLVDDIPVNQLFRKIAGKENDIEIVCEYIGPSFTDQFGNNIPANKPYLFRYKKFFQPINWEVMFYPLDTAHHNPIKTGTLFSMVEKKAPFKTEKVDKLDYAWWGGIKEAGITYPQFITVAAGTAEIPKADYELSVTWDDAIRVYVDEKLVIDEWNPSLYTFDESPHKKVRLSLGGIHQFRVEHIELGGFATLSLKLKPVE